MPGDIITWIDATGEEYPLVDIPNTAVQPGRVGFTAPPAIIEEDRLPLRNGTMLRRVSFGPRDVDIPLFLKAATHNALRARVDEINAILNPLTGIGKLKVERPDGVTRELNCIYRQGLEGNENNENFGVVWMRYILTLHAFDPFWYDEEATYSEYTSGVAVPFLNPLLPLKLTSTSIFVTIPTINNTGDVEVWPTWTIYGPGENPILRNMDTDEKMDFTGQTLVTGEYIQITTVDGITTVTKSGGINLYGELSSDSVIFPLYKGNNNIRLDMQNTDASSKITLSYKKAYIGV